MDPIAIAGSAINVLNAVKEQLQRCENIIGEAGELRKALQMFEVTILMIPNRSKEEDTAETENEQLTIEQRSKEAPELMSPDLNMTINPLARVTKEYGTELTKFGVGKGVSAVLEHTPFGLLHDLFKIGENGEPIFDEAPAPAETLRDMKLVYKNGLRVHSDLDVMFVGMAFVISAALSSLNEAKDTLMEMNELQKQKFSFWWVCMPWKIKRLEALGAELANHREMLQKQTQTLQTSIGIASYAVQLEQLDR